MAYFDGEDEEKTDGEETVDAPTADGPEAAAA